jgi:hypothetical protein
MPGDGHGDSPVRFLGSQDAQPTAGRGHADLVAELLEDVESVAVGFRCGRPQTVPVSHPSAVLYRPGTTDHGRADRLRLEIHS